MTPEKSIFKAYDIRGIVGKTLTPEVVYEIGLVLGTWAREKGIESFCVGRDGRTSGPELSAALMKGDRHRHGAYARSLFRDELL